jgi:hypothetical protein
LDSKSPGHISDGKVSGLADVKKPLGDIKKPLWDIKKTLWDIKMPLWDIKRPLWDIKKSLWDIKRPLWNILLVKSDGFVHTKQHFSIHMCSLTKLGIKRFVETKPTTTKDATWEGQRFTETKQALLHNIYVLPG